MTETLYEWDDAKRHANFEKHGVDFAVIDAFDWDTAVTNPDTRHGEPRWIAYGYIGRRLHAVVYLVRGSRRRIISLRKANTREETRYARRQAR